MINIDASTTFTDDPIDFSPANAGIAYQRSFADLGSDFENLALSDYAPGGCCIFGRSDYGTFCLEQRPCENLFAGM